jgi:hypothetical protein
MTLAIFRRNSRDSARSPAPDLMKSAGAREYDARVRERTADRLAAKGDAEGARLERAAADDLRRVPARPARVRKPDRLAGASSGAYRIYR